MFSFFKRLSYNRKDLKALSEIIIKNDKEILAKEIFLNKIYQKHNELKTSFENNQIFEYAKFLNIFFNIFFNKKSISFFTSNSLLVSF